MASDTNTPPASNPANPQAPGNAGPPTVSPPAGPMPAKPPFYKRPVLMTVLIILIGGGLIYGLLYWLNARHYETTDDAYLEGSVVPISPKIDGIVSEVLINDNQNVTKDQPLVRIDARDFQAKLDQAKAQMAAAQSHLLVAQMDVQLVHANTEAALTQAQAGVAQAKAGVATAEAQLASAQADVVAAEADATRRQTDLKRYQSLDTRVVSQQQLDAAKAASDTADAQLTAASKRVTAAEAQVSEAQAKVSDAQGTLAVAQTAPQQIASANAKAASAKAAVQQAQAAVDAAQLQLSYTEIHAPSTGRITRKAVLPGQYIQAGQTIFAIVQPEVWMIANFKETQLTHIHQGQPADVYVDAYPGQVFHGEVNSIQAGSGARFSMLPPENATGNFVKVVQRVPVKITFDRDAEAKILLAPGMSGEPKVRIDAGEEPAAIPPSSGQASAPDGQ